MTSVSVESLFEDYKARRTALLRALTSDANKFYALCDPERENLCLFGLPDESWEVSVPASMTPPDFPQPVLGINFARDGMSRRGWLSLVALHSDTWLLSVAFFFAWPLNQIERNRLFSLINELPTLFQVVTEIAIEDNHTTDSGHKSGSCLKTSNDGHVETNSKLLDESNGVDEELP